VPCNGGFCDFRDTTERYAGFRDLGFREVCRCGRRHLQHTIPVPSKDATVGVSVAAGKGLPAGAGSGGVVPPVLHLVHPGGRITMLQGTLAAQAQQLAVKSLAVSSVRAYAPTADRFQDHC
jgi:hypothetical protein